MNLKGIKVLVTGGAGFIGSELVRQLASKNAEVIVLDNMVNGKRENLDGLDKNQVRLEVGDILDDVITFKYMEKIDVVYHLACLGVRHSVHSPYKNHEVNAGGTLKLLINARKKNVSKFVYVSSSEVYGTALWVPMNENHPTFPPTVYGSSKLAGECYVRAFYHTYGFPTVILRPFNTYGPRCHHEGDSGEVIPKFMLRCLANKPMIIFGEGNQTRDFTYVSDTARGILIAGFKENIFGYTINLGIGSEISINNLAKIISTVVGKSNEIVNYDESRPGDNLRLYSDINLANNLLNFKPDIKLEDGLFKLKNWYLSMDKTPEMLLKEEKVHNWEL